MKVNYIHRRYIKDNVIHNRGGSTVAFRELGNGFIEYATSYCSPKDNFNKKFGRIKATGRLSSNIHRKVVHMSWSEFFHNFYYDEEY